MSLEQRQIKKWPGIIAKKFMKAKENSKFKIIQADDSSLDCFYILIKLSGGHYKDQTHILEFKTKHSSPVLLFPFNPPLVTFITTIFHPNVSVKGGICLDIFNDKTKWSPSYDFEAVMTSIELLLDVPNNASPYNSESSKMFTECEKKYKTATTGIKDFVESDAIYNLSFKPFDTFSNTYYTKNNSHILPKYIPLFEAEYKTDEQKSESAENSKETKTQ